MANEDAPETDRKSLPKTGHSDLDALGGRLAKQRSRKEPESAFTRRLKSTPSSALGLAFRVGVELVSALAVGLGIGWLLDAWLGTRPWMMIVFIILGSAAGVLNVYRIASGYGYAAGYQKNDTPEADKNNNRDQGG